MEGIKAKIVFSFCVTVFAIITVVAIAVSWKLSSSTSAQSRMVADEMTSHSYEVVQGHHKLLEASLGNIQEDVTRFTSDLVKNPIVPANIEEQHIRTLEKLLGTLCKRSGIDFAILYDTDGKDQASFPERLLGDIAGKYYKFSDLGKQVRTILKGNTKPEKVRLQSVYKHDSEFLKAFGLEAKDTLGKGGIIVASAGIIEDDFGDPMGSAIIGKILNGYDKPFQQLNKATGSVAALYMDTTLIAQAGFDNSKQKERAIAALEMDPSVLEEVYRADRPKNIRQKLGTKIYLTTCSAIKSFKNEKIGVLLTGVPEKQILQTQELMVSHGIETRKSVQRWLFVIGAIALGLFLAIALLLSTGIVKSIQPVITGITQISDQVASASRQIWSSSQGLAEGSSEQAASIEETSSSLEEMSSMTNQNADNANQADQLMKEANQVVGNANASMRELTGSMAEISKASEETQKIVKTIDEIAFQTNLLALNAAVEAARAGEAGAGFAVVADEVRNLAMRAAEAAKNTAGLIEGTVKKVKDGGDLVTRTNEAFVQVAESSSKVGQLVGEIAAASNEQAQGIGQVNTAVVEMDKVVQQNAANAEESASASEEMNAQAEQLKVMVADLVALVGGSRNGKNGKQATVSQLAEEGTYHRQVAASEGGSDKKVLLDQPKAVSPKKVIPMDDDFKDF